MKKIFFLFLSVLFLASCAGDRNDQTIVSVYLVNANFEEIQITLYTDFVGNNHKTISAEAGPDSIFTFELSLSAPQFANLQAGTRQLTLFLDQGQLLTISADMDMWDETLEFTGDHAFENELLREQSQEFHPQYANNIIYGKIQNTDANGFKEFMNEMMEDAEAMVEAYEEKAPLNADFKTLLLGDVRYNKYSMILNYRYIYSYFTGEEPEIPEDFYAPLDNALEFDDILYNTPRIYGFLNEYGFHYLNENEDEFEDDLSHSEKLMVFARNELSGRSKYYVKATAINSALNWGDYRWGEETFMSYKESNPYSSFSESLTRVYESAKKVAPGNPAPGFAINDINGEEVSLDDFAGKVVYLDFWASWCGPCMREVPYAKELKAHFEGQDDLVFLYISVDENETAWRNTVEEHQIQGVHLNISGMRHEVANNYNVRGVPSFFIIDRNGIIHDNSPGRPSSGEVIISQLEEALGGEV